MAAYRLPLSANRFRFLRGNGEAGSAVRKPGARCWKLAAECAILDDSSQALDPLRAEVAELADAQASGACGRKVVEVQILSSAPFDSPRLQRGSLMASRDPFSRRVECPERAQRVEGPCFPCRSVASSSCALRLHSSLRRSVLYIGSTGDVDARVAMHNEGRGGSYTCQRRPVTLVLVEMHETVESASHRERQIKRWSRAKKESLISGDATALKRLAISHSSRSFNGS